MTGRPGFWELAGAGAAVGGTGVWGLSAAARVGLLRMLLEVFPRSTWDGVTWALIPALMLAPPVLQGAVQSYLGGGRPAPLWRGIVGSVAGTVVAAAIFGAAILEGVRRLPSQTVSGLARMTPEVLIPVFGTLLVAGSLLILGRLGRLRWLRWGAVPLAAAVVLAAWLRAHGQALALAYVLDRPEVNGFFAAVAVGGAAGGAWAAGAGRRAGRAQTAPASPPGARAPRARQREAG